MKNRIFNAFLLLAMVGLMFTSCKKEIHEPPIQDLPIGTVYTIDEILAMESGTVFTEDASVYGIITADEQSGNLYKVAFMQDRATGAAIELYLNAVSGVRIGDSIRIYLKDVTFSMYNNLPQLTNFEADGHIIILANNKPIEPQLTTIANINAGRHLAGLVRLENVKFTEENTFAEPTTYGNRTLADPTDYSQTVIVRTSNYANFAYDSLPQGTGNLVAIASVYGSTWQLYIRSIRELEFDGYTPGGDADLPYYQDFTSSFGTYTTYDVAGPQSWEIDYNTAKMTGFVNNTNNANEDWLISKRFSLENVSEASMTMTYIARYFNDLDSDITVQVSSDYTSGDPNQATWTQVPASWTSGSNWTDFASTTLDLSQFVGQKVTVAVKYVSTDEKAGTIEVQSILIQEGSGPTPPPGPGTGGEVQNMPYCQSFASEFGTYMTYDLYGSESWVIDYSTAKMTGYVGGSYNANEDWLISSPVAITGVTDAKMTMNYIGRYFNNINEEVTIWASTDYTWGSDPTTATWTQVSASLSEGSNWSNFLTAEIALTEFVGQTVTFAVKYVSTDSKAGTMEIQSICIEEGSGTGPTPPPGPGTVEGDGSRENPYTANDIILMGIETSDGNKYWVKDYIVGFIDGSYVYQFTSTTDVNTNITLSSNQNASSESECIPIQLPAGDVRNGLNLADNPGNLGQEVLLYGTLEKYYRVPGVKNVTYAEINGNGIGTDPGDTPTPPGPGTTEYFNQVLTTQTSFNTFSSYSVAGDQEWYFNTSHPEYGAVMSGYDNTSHANEDWFISPVIDLSGSTSPILNFEHARGPQDSMNVGVEDGYYTVWVTNDYIDGEDPNQERWVELPILNQPTVKWQFVSAGDLVIPAEFKTSTCRIAFRYLCTDDASATWEIKNVVVKEQ